MLNLNKKKYKLLIEGCVIYNKIIPKLINDDKILNYKRNSNLVLINNYECDSESTISNIILINDYTEQEHHSTKSQCCCF